MFETPQDGDPPTHDPNGGLPRLIAIMARLRDPERGCPWDLAQDFASIAPYTIEEAYEVADAIERGDLADLRDELGDLLLQVVYHARLAEESGAFDFDAVARGASDKMVRRHPHVFGDANFARAEDVLDNWDQLKADERKASGKVEKVMDSILDEVPVHFPALLEGLKLTKRAAKVGFDWENADQIFDKLTEETAELRSAIKNGDQTNIDEEIGDLLFVIMNLARHLDVEPETALNKTNRKFRQRFKFIEDKLRREGKTLEDADLEEMDDLWNQAKLNRSTASF